MAPMTASKANGSRLSDTVSDQAIRKAIEERAEKRAQRSVEKRKTSELLKNQGNDAYKQQNYQEAIGFYIRALEDKGGSRNPVLFSNLAAAFLKIGRFDLAEDAATKSLERDPTSTKARYRRGMARKGLQQYKAALVDFENVMDHDPSCSAARDELAEVLGLWMQSQELDTESQTDDNSDINAYDWPPHRERDQDMDESGSDSSDFQHLGNGEPCQLYNHGGCALGSDCQFSHGPDGAKSIRDRLGKNVCLLLLLDMCEYTDETCYFSHTTTYLPENGWWTHPERSAALKNMFLPAFEDDDKFEQLLDGISALGGHRGPEPYRDAEGMPGDAPQSDGLGRGQQIYHAFKNLRQIMQIEPDADETLDTAGQISPADDHFVLLLSLSNDDSFTRVHQHVLSALRSKIRVLEAVTPKEAMEHLASSSLAGVFVTDADISERKHSKVLTKLVKYTKQGGKVVLGGWFSGHIKMNVLESFFRNAWGLPWKRGDYHRTTFARNPNSETVKLNPSLAPSYSMKALHLKDYNPSTAVYLPTENSRIQSFVFPRNPITNLTESPVVHTQVGSGYMGYIGDVNAEEESTNVVMAMLGLLDYTYETSAPPVAATSSKPEASGSGTGARANLPQSRARQPSKRSPAGSSAEAGSSQRNGSPALQAHQPLTVTPTVAAKAPDPKDRFVLILSLENESWYAETHKHVLAALHAKIRIIRATTTLVALEHLASPDLAGVFITDAGVSRPQNAKVLPKLVEYAKGGGMVVLGGAFSSNIGMDTLNAFFRRTWALSWKSGSYHRTTFSCNPSNHTAKFNPSLAPSYSMKALHLKDIRSTEAVYIPTEDSHLESLVQSKRKITNHTEAPVVQAQVGSGYLGYVGDVNTEEESTSVVLALLGLLDHDPRSPSPDLAPPQSQQLQVEAAPAASTSTFSNAFILVLTLDNHEFFAKMYENLLSALRRKIKVVQASKVKPAMKHLGSPDLAGVFAADAGISLPEHNIVLAKLVDFTKKGGLVAVGGLFSSFVNLYHIDVFFDQGWGLPWRRGSYQGETFDLNSKHETAKLNPSLDSSFSTKAVYLKGTDLETAIYLQPEEEEEDESDDEYNYHTTKIFETPVAHTQVGRGWMGYVGDVNAHESSTKIILAMLGLLDHKYSK